MDQLESFAKPALEALKNPYVIGVIGILALVYGNLMAPNLPPTIALWFDNPIFKVLFIFLILGARHVHPTLAIILTLGFVISLQTLHRYNVQMMGKQVSAMASAKKAVVDKARAMAQKVTGKKPTEAEVAQLRQELAQSVAQAKAKASAPIPTQASERFQIEEQEAFAPQGLPDARVDPVKSMHPMNRPTWETNLLKPRVEDPDDPSHPGWSTLGTANVDVSLYDLNPPYLRHNLPQEMGKAIPRADDPKIFPPQFENKISGVKVPADNSSRYSSAHGHNVNAGVASPTARSMHMPYPSPQHNEDLANNLPSPYVTPDRQYLPDSFMADPVLPQNHSYVSAKLMNGSIGPQGLNRPTGVEAGLAQY